MPDLQETFDHIGQMFKNLGADEALLLGLQQKVAALEAEQPPPAPPSGGPFATEADLQALQAQVAALPPAPDLTAYAKTADLAALADRVTVIESGLQGIDPGANAAGVNIAPSTLGDLTVGDVVNVTLTFSGGTPPYAPSVESGAFPIDLSMGAGGLITGTLTAASEGPFDVTVQVHDANGVQGSVEFTGTVAALPVPEPVPAPEPTPEPEPAPPAPAAPESPPAAA